MTFGGYAPFAELVFFAADLATFDLAELALQVGIALALTLRLTQPPSQAARAVDTSPRVRRSARTPFVWLTTGFGLSRHQERYRRFRTRHLPNAMNSRRRMSDMGLPPAEE
jgi:hypothetical protein